MLKTDYLDEIVQGGNRTYNIVDKNSDVLERDIRIVPTYTKLQEGSKLGANDVNAQNKLLNQLSSASLLINRDFQIWQTGESVSQGVNDKDTYGPDRWRFNIDARTSCARESTNGGCYLSIGGANFGSFGQRIEMNKEIISMLKGKKVTVSFMMRAINSTINNIFVELSGNKSVKKSYNLVKGGNEYFEFTFNVDDLITSTTLPHLILNVIKKENGNNFSASDVIYIKYVDLVVGEVATSFVSRTYGEELSLCQRYYVDELVIRATSPIVIGSDIYFSCSAIFPTEMRVKPTVIPYNWISYPKVQTISRPQYTMNNKGVWEIMVQGAGLENAKYIELTASFDAEIR